jgi:hypothetical protein
MSLMQINCKLISFLPGAKTLEIQQEVSDYIFKYCYVAVANAKIFKEEFNKRNFKLMAGNLNLQSMRLGINSVIALSNCISS